MNVLLFLSLWLAMIMSSCCENVGSDEDEEVTTEYYDYLTVTGTPDYDYNATFDYYYVTGVYEVKEKDVMERDVRSGGVKHKASGIGQLTPVVLLGLAVLQMWS